MRLSEFIVSKKEQILSEWEEFARSLLPASQAMNIEELRDHAEGILMGIANDLERPQTKAEQVAKSRGQADPGRAAQTEAAAHGAVRAGKGFTLAQMLSEFRALRASVLRLWAESGGGNVEEMTRFNEAVDQAMAESSRRFTDDLDHSKDLFLGILGHDLQNPLGAIMMSAGQLLRNVEHDGQLEKNASRIMRSSIRMKEIISDLLDLTRARMGTGMPMQPAPTQLDEICRDAVEEAQSLVPGSKIDLRMRGQLSGAWDGARIGQALSNLIGNAVKHGQEDGPITVRAWGDADRVVLNVHNWGKVIPRSELSRIFQPLRRVEPDPSSSGLGLGLFIAKEIVAAHGGLIEVESTPERGTTFTVTLPRAPLHEPAAAPH